MGNLTQAQLLMTTAAGLAPSEYKDQIRQLGQSTQPPKVTISPTVTAPAPTAQNATPSQPLAQPQLVK
jgi:hypothetical protein